MDPMRAADVPVRPAATVMLLRDGAAGPEVFMLKRTMSASFAHGAYVFPGGAVDDADHGEHFEPVCDGLDDVTASRRLGLDHGGLAWYVAALRECFEEAGVLLARRHDDGDVIGFDDATATRFDTARRAIHAGERSLVDLCMAEALHLLPDRLHFVDHWLTPVGEPRRFDTRFFVAAAPLSQRPLHDDHETIASAWVRAGDALDRHAAGELQMLHPTVARLEWLARQATMADAIADAAAAAIPQRVMPRLKVDADHRLLAVVLPGEPGYESVTDPEFVVARRH